MAMSGLQSCGIGLSKWAISNGIGDRPKADNISYLNTFSIELYFCETDAYRRYPFRPHNMGFQKLLTSAPN